MAVCQLRGLKSELVEDRYIVLWAVTITPQNKTTKTTTKQHPHKQKTEKTTNEPNKKHTKERNRKVTGRPVQQPGDEWEVIALYHLQNWYARKARVKPNKHHIAIPKCEWSNTAPCGNQGSPQPGSPRSHRASHQGITTHILHFVASNDNAV